MNKKLLLLVDYRDYFYIACGKGDACLDVQLFSQQLRRLNFDVEVKQFSDIAFLRDNYSGWWVVYQSSEDYQLQYKSYIEDVILGLQWQGARLVPRINCFHAHHNKVFMEIFRDLSGVPAVQTISSREFGCLEELERGIDLITYPAVIKPSSGQGSAGVALAYGPSELLRRARKLSSTFYFKEFAKNIVKRILGRSQKSLHRRKFIVQNFIAGLKDDYKVLVLGDRYYVLRRGNRKNDFRASGSGIFEYPPDAHKHLRHILDYSKEIFQAFDCPLLSLDIGYDGATCHLLEFQFMHFGTFAAERAEMYYVYSGNDWAGIREPCQLETVIAEAMAMYIGRKEEKLL